MKAIERLVAWLGDGKLRSVIIVAAVDAVCGRDGNTRFDEVNDDAGTCAWDSDIVSDQAIAMINAICRIVAGLGLKMFFSNHLIVSIL